MNFQYNTTAFDEFEASLILSSAIKGVAGSSSLRKGIVVCFDYLIFIFVLFTLKMAIFINLVEIRS